MLSDQLRVVLLCAGMSVCVFGCGNPKPPVAEVTGTVTLDGKPLELVHVEFWPEVGPRAFGKTDASGKFSLITDDRTQEGCPPGRNKVAIRDTAHMKDDYIDDGGDWVDMSNGKKSRISSKYYDAPNSPLTVEVKPGEKNNFDFPVDARVDTP
jgi:hypothetical protein